MYWKKNPLNYEICIPPLSKPFHLLTHREAEAYFQWHLSHLDERIDYLSTTVSNFLGIPKLKIDYSPNSLVLVWAWFLSVAKTERTPEEHLIKLEKQFAIDSEPFKTYLLDQSKEQFSLETEFILRDIGMYLGEVFTKNEPVIYWTYYDKPKSDFFVNMPVLFGFEDPNFVPPFKMEFEPTHMARVQAANIWDNTQRKEDLFNIYCKWASNYIPNGTGNGSKLLKNSD